ncbi:PRA1 family protein F3-like [Quercus robur]|uniref:PRA1 family protein F3-like n=1 Tax=Quercus robur TaxID=38942 RepID=UPI002162DCB1|nr:PRA1 family protein F3-like [Quercus robur]XP_050289391.1 PRA1 family protein F3-like [Quercus robur]
MARERGSLVHPFSSFTRPDTLGEATARFKRNLGHFRVNYTFIALLILFLSLLWHPISMIVFLAIFVAWSFLYFLRDRPLLLFHITVDDRIVLALLFIIIIIFDPNAKHHPNATQSPPKFDPHAGNPRPPRLHHSFSDQASTPLPPFR